MIPVKCHTVALTIQATAHGWHSYGSKIIISLPIYLKESFDRELESIEML